MSGVSIAMGFKPIAMEMPQAVKFYLKFMSGLTPFVKNTYISRATQLLRTNNY
jgi:hypothetical protein